jgi:hypothetical protein
LRKLWLNMYTNALSCAILSIRYKLWYRDAKETTYDIRVAVSENQTALHIDSDDNQGRYPSDFYLVFTDIYIMARARCLTYGGGFGALPTRMNSNTCTLHQT